MSKDNLTVTYMEDEADRTASEISDKNYRYFPVLDYGRRVVGVISGKELFYRCGSREH